MEMGTLLGCIQHLHSVVVCLCSVPGRVFIYVIMSVFVQEIVVGVILILAIAWIVWQLIRRKKSVSTCNCEGCPFADCQGRKNIKFDCKKVDKKVAHFDK